MVAVIFNLLRRLAVGAGCDLSRICDAIFIAKSLWHASRERGCYVTATSDC